MAGILAVLSCEVGPQCLNSTENTDLGSSKCGVCRFSPNGEQSYQAWWKPRVPKTPHPAASAEARRKKSDRKAALDFARANRDRGKSLLQRQAAQAEKTTERNMIRSTKNSGRSNKDGDHVAAGDITLDTKLQTTRDHPVVLIPELMKVVADAMRAGKVMGALVLRNKSGVGVVAMREEDFARLIQRLA